jgi:hydrogenase nickel incorporation protein HypA/HybF
MMFSLVEAIAKCKGARRAFFHCKNTATVTGSLLNTGHRRVRRKREIEVIFADPISTFIGGISRYSHVTRGRAPGLQSGAREATLFPTEVKPLHEITVALSLLESIESTAAEQGIERVNAVHVRVGALSGVVRDALLFSWDVATARTIAEGSQLVVEEVPLVVFCERCEAERSPHSGTGLLCPACGTPSPNILRGREMQLVSMEVPA